MTRLSGNPLAGAVDVLVIGAGHSGLAISRFLSARCIDHVILERGEVANSWRTERWDSLKLLTPNWQSRLPGYCYSGSDPDGYMSMHEVIDFISGYAECSRAPVETDTEVKSVQPLDSGYRVVTNRGEWRTRVLVIASGAFNLPLIPAVSQALPANIRQLSTRDYRDPGQLENAGVMIIGASASGLQLADEIQASGRQVTLAVGEHVRLPRLYRGKDIQHWMHVTGVLDEKYDAIDDIRRARGVSSPQLVGSRDRRTLDLNVLSAAGVRLAGRLAGVRDGKLQFSGSLRNVCQLADLKMNRLLDSIDDWIVEQGVDEGLDSAERFAPTRIPDSPCLGLDLADGEIGTVVWATGYRPDYSWLEVPVLDRKGQIRHDGGVVDSPGMYILGLPYLRRRKSSFIHGAEDDARDLGEHIVAYLDVVSATSRIKMAV
ncbi:MAG: NAD(P)-binding domain-containing protein [Gammaproteobacteria bacterium]|nr:MAG: pyridine nucleotide-disulfide oxidoreductase [Gammaproteobacteria bacterium]UCH38702.1 MAG: NAD(P)-binding domain-containing protein [Gammaproteobacteria bacterium]